MKIELDAMLTAAEGAAWLKLSVRELASKSRGERPEIPVMSWGKKTKRYHPRTIITVAAARAGVRPELIAASFGLNEVKR